MIQPQPGRPGVIGEQHGLARLTETLEALSRGQTQQHQRDSQIQEHLTTLSTHFVALIQKSTYLVLAVGILAVLMLTLCGLVSWQITHRPEMGYARALGAIDATLGQTWMSLPKPVQEQLSTTYSRVGLASPGERQRK